MHDDHPGDARTRPSRTPQTPRTPVHGSDVCESGVRQPDVCERDVCESDGRERDTREPGVHGPDPRGPEVHGPGAHGLGAHGPGGHRSLRLIDRGILRALRACGGDARVAALARGLSWSGEHGALWLVSGLVGAAVDGRRRGAWVRGTVLTAGAHVASMGVKRLVRRPRPAGVEPLVRTAGRHSFPSSHAASSAAAVVACGVLCPADGSPARVVRSLAAAMCVSRLVVGVHYPSDVVAGAALGALVARLGTRWMTRSPAHATAPAPRPPRPARTVRSSAPHTALIALTAAAPAVTVLPTRARVRPKGRRHV